MNGKWLVVGLLILCLSAVLYAVQFRMQHGIGKPKGFHGERHVTAAPVAFKQCSTCHVAPRPVDLPTGQWESILQHMKVVAKRRAEIEFSDEDLQSILAWLQFESEKKLPRLPPDPRVDTSPLQFQASSIGQCNDDELTAITHVQAVDLNGDGVMEVLVSDAGQDQLIHMTWEDGQWWERPLASMSDPARQVVFDFDQDGDLDIVVAVLGSVVPTDEEVGSVVLLVNNGRGTFESRTLLDGVGRVADVQPADFDGDGDIDFVVAVFGFFKTGMVGWLQQEDDGSFRFRSIIESTGAIDVPVTDLDGDGLPDFIVLLSQEHEEIVACLNDGSGGFEEVTLYKAPTPLWGSSGIELLDLDGDGDMDLLYTNGDAMDAPDLSKVMRPYHGIQWLENHGDLKFEYHDIIRWYGVYDAQAVDLDDDGDLDIVGASMFNHWQDPNRRSLIWLANDGEMNFTAHGIASDPTHRITVTTADFTGSGHIQILTGGLHLYPPYTRKSRLTLFQRK